MNAYLKRKSTMREKKQKLLHFMVSASFRFSIIAFIVVFGLLYIWQTNSVSTRGYQISDLEQKIKELEQENRKLDVHIAEFSSMQSIEARLANTDLVPVDSVEYIALVGSAVAQR